MARRVFLPVAIVVASLGFASYATAAVSPFWGVTGGSSSRASSLTSHRLSGRRRSAAAETALLRRAPSPSLAAPALSGETGGISGVVTSAATKLPVAGIEVCAYEIEELLFECAVTSAAGEYTLTRLQPGNYLVEFAIPFESNPGNLDYVTQYYNGKASETEAEPVSVIGGRTLTNINAALEPGGEISGTVTNTLSAPLANIDACALDPVERLPERCAVTNALGEYTIAGITPGEHDVEFAVAAGNQQNYAPQFYKGSASLSSASGVSVIAETTKSGIDAVLSPGGEITGTVTSFTTHAALAAVEVCAAPVGSGPLSRCTATGAGGGYDLRSLGTEEYDVLFLDLGGEYAPQYYKEASLLSSASAVSVKAGSVETEIDAALKLPVPVNVAVPRISGSPVQGQTLKVIHGSWTNAPTSYEDEWGLCTNSSEITSCHTVAVGEAVTLSAQDVGDALRVRELAVNASGGDGEYAYSAPSALVTRPTGIGAGPVVGSTPPPPVNGIVPAPAAAGRVLSAMTSSPSAGQFKELLDGLLGPRGTNAKIGALLRHGGYPVSAKALSAGRLVISWYLAPKAGHPANVLIAVGRLSFTTAGTAKLSIKLTAKGKSVLAGAKQVKLIAKGAFTPSGQGAISATRSFTLKR